MIRRLISATEHFKTLDKIQQKIILNKSNIEVIRHGHKMSSLTSYDNWVTKFSPRQGIKIIVKQLLENGK